MSDKTFDELLAKHLQTSTPYIDDEGFTAELMARIPAPRHINYWLEKLIIVLPVSLMALLVLAQFPWRTLAQPIYAWVLTMNMANLLPIALALALAAVLIPMSLMVKHKFI